MAKPNLIQFTAFHILSMRLGQREWISFLERIIKAVCLLDQNSALSSWYHKLTELPDLFSLPHQFMFMFLVLSSSPVSRSLSSSCSLFFFLSLVCDSLFFPTHLKVILESTSTILSGNAA